MSNFTVEAIVAARIKEHVPSWDGNLDDATLAERIDSLGYLEMLFALEEEFNTELPYDLSELKTPRDLIKHIERIEAAQQKTRWSG